MKKVLLILLLFFAQLSSAQNWEEAPVSTQEWREAATAADGQTTFYVRLDKIEGSDLHIWLKAVYADKVVKLKNGKTKKVKQGYALKYVTLHCGDRTFDVSEYIIYDGDGKVSDSGKLFQFKERLIPDSVMEGVYMYVCQD